MASFTVRESRSNDPVVFTCAGRLDNTGGAILEEALQPILAAKITEVVLDFAGVTYLSSAGVRSLLVALKKAKLSGGNLALSNVTAEAEQVLQLAGMRGLFKTSKITAAL